MAKSARTIDLVQDEDGQYKSLHEKEKDEAKRAEDRKLDEKSKEIRMNKDIELLKEMIQKDPQEAKAAMLRMKTQNNPHFESVIGKDNSLKDFYTKNVVSQEKPQPNNVNTSKTDEDKNKDSQPAGTSKQEKDEGVKQMQENSGKEQKVDQGKEAEQVKNPVGNGKDDRDDELITIKRSELKKLMQEAIREQSLSHRTKLKLKGVMDRASGKINEYTGGEKVTKFLKDKVTKSKAWTKVAGMFNKGLKAAKTVKGYGDRVVGNANEYADIQSRLEQCVTEYSGRKDARGNRYELHEIIPDSKEKGLEQGNKEYILCLHGANGVDKFASIPPKSIDKNLGREELLGFIMADSKNLTAIREPGAHVTKGHDGKAAVFYDKQLSKNQEPNQKVGTVDKAKNLMSYAAHKVTNKFRGTVSNIANRGQEAPGGDSKDR